MSWSDSGDDDLLLTAVSQASTKANATKHASLPKVKSRTKSSVKTSSQKLTSWVSSSFDDFGQDFSASQPAATSTKEKTVTRKRAREPSEGTSSIDQDTVATLKNKHNGKSSTVDSSGELWADRHAPKNSGELAVHKKKIQEVQGWLEYSFKQKQLQAPLLLLTGPSGCGKTACLRVLGKELGCEVQEWINPLTSSYDGSKRSWEDSRSFASIGMPVSESQATLFRDFLLRANKYPTLAIFNQDQLYRKLILVEDFPNVFFRDVSQFHEILRIYQKRSHCPLVFIVSDSVAGESNERLLFPKNIQADLNIANISFNPVAQTSLTKVLSRIANIEASKLQNKRTFSIPGKATTDGLASSSNGDIRGAINALQFACLKGKVSLPLKLHSGKSQSKVSKTKSKLRDKFAANTTKKKQQKCDKNSRDADKGDNGLASIGGKDTSLFLFRALGKILYCKRDSPGSGNSSAAALPSHLSHHYRDPLLVDPEDVLEKSHLSSDFFVAYLHQNYPEFYSSIDDVVRASEYISDSDYFTAEWANRSVLNSYSASVASRGIMFSNSDRATHSGSTGSKLGWKPLHKPQWFDINKKIRNNQSAAKSLFAGHCTPLELHTLLVPYMALINVRMCDHVRANYIREVGRMSRYVRTSAERLDEKDMSMLAAASDDISQDQSIMFSESLDSGIPSCSFIAPITEEVHCAGRSAVPDSSLYGSDQLGDVTVIEGRAGPDDNDDFIIEDFED